MTTVKAFCLTVSTYMAMGPFPVSNGFWLDVTEGDPFGAFCAFPVKKEIGTQKQGNQ